MTRDTFELSRRKILAGLGAVGAASAGAGFGSSAYFSDTESFQGNQLVAGSLDLKIDWEEHYSDWSSDEAMDVEGTLDIVMLEPGEDVPDGYTGFPFTDPGIAVADEDVTQFMLNTAIDSFPDADDDGVSDLRMFMDGAQQEPPDPCETLGDLPAALDSDARTESSRGDPLIQLEDVKPGDFGEVTFSLHVCDNDGYVWLTGEQVSASENGVNEAEADDEEEVEGTVELLDEVQTLLWYDDDHDNVYEPAAQTGEVDVGIVMDISGSMGGTKIATATDGAETLVDELNGDDQASLITYETQANRVTDLTPMTSGNKTSLQSTISGLDDDTDGFTNVEGGIIYAAEEVLGDETFDGGVTTNPSGNNRADAEPVIVLLSDGVANRYYDDSGTVQSGEATAESQAIAAASAAKTAGVRVFTIAYGDGADDAALQSMASPGDFYEAQNVDDVQQVFAQIAGALAGEQCFWTGTLRETLDLLSSTGPNGRPGIPLDGNRAEGDFAEVTGNDTDGDNIPDENVAPGDGTAETRQCFTGSVTQCIGFQWWLPVDHGNEVQSDRVEFDLGFYTEQCRHNSGAGLAEEQQAD